MPRRNPSLVGAKLSLSAHRNKFVTFYRGGYLQSGFQLRLRHPTRKPLPARKLTRSNQRASRRARIPTCAVSMRAGCSSRSLGPETASYEVRHSPRCAIPSTGACATRWPTDRWARVLQPFGAAREPVLDRVQDRAAIAHRQDRCPRDARSRSRDARQAWAQRERQRERIRQKRLIQHGTLCSHRLLSRKRRPRRGRQRRPPPTARPRRCGPGAGCEGSPQEAAALQSRRRWHHLGGR